MQPSVHPNINAAVYRNMTAADRPPVPDKNLQFIAIYNEKSAILGGSNMTDRYWSGTVWHYNDISSFDREKAFLATKTESGVCDGAQLAENKFVIGEDSGVLQVVGVTEATDSNLQELQCLGSACQHDDSLLTLAVTTDKSRVVTGGMDYCIKVWDIEELIATYSFGCAHTDIVTSVDTKPGCDSVFISVSLDSEALMWDVRETKPAKSIFNNNTSGLTAVSWNPSLDHIVAIGNRKGDVTLFDIRNLEAPLHTDVSLFSRGVHRLKFNPNTSRQEQLACCCDDIAVKVVNINKALSLVYENNDHNDFVRGLAWHADNLYTCSWDNSVKKHAVNSENGQ